MYYSEELTNLDKLKTENNILIINNIHSVKMVYTIRDISGKVLLSGDFEGNEFVLSFPRFSDGLYILILNDGRHVYYFKLLKKTL